MMSCVVQISDPVTFRPVFDSIVVTAFMPNAIIFIEAGSLYGVWPA